MSKVIPIGSYGPIILGLSDKPIASLGELFDVLAKLDLDEGVRINGRFRDKSCYIFITKSATGYTLAVFEASKNPGGLGRQIMIRDSLRLDDVKEFVERSCEMPLKAYRY